MCIPMTEVPANEGRNCRCAYMHAAADAPLNQDDVDPISLDPISSLREDNTFRVPANGGGYRVYDADAWLSHLMHSDHRRQHPITRQILQPVAVWECLSRCHARNPADPRVVTCLSTEVRSTRSPAGMISVRPVSPLLDVSLRSMENSPTTGGGDTQRFEVTYQLVDSRDARRLIGKERKVTIVCPVRDRISVF